jgi:hypothetical protein
MRVEMRGELKKSDLPIANTINIKHIILNLSLDEIFNKHTVIIDALINIKRSPLTNPNDKNIIDKVATISTMCL